MSLTRATSFQDLLAAPERRFSTLVLVASYHLSRIPTGQTSDARSRSARRNTLKLYREVQPIAVAASNPSIWEVWWRKPDCWRDDFAFNTGGKTSTVHCKGVITQYLAADAIYTTDPLVGFAESSTLKLSDGDRLDRRTPSERAHDMPLLGGTFARDGWKLLRGGERQLCGRPGIEFVANWSSPGDPPTGWPWMKEYRGLVDIERGILLELTGWLREGQNGLTISAISVSFDQQISDGLFVVDAPSRTKVIRVSD